MRRDRLRLSAGTRAALCLLALVAVHGCGDDDDGGAAASGGADGTSGSAGRDPFGNSNSDASVNKPRPPLDSGILPPVTGCGHLVVRNLDLLFMVDNSGSMREEQEALRREFPKMIRVLTSGDRNADGEEDFPPIAELHLAVVSSDMGLVGITAIDKCEGLGHDGVMQHTPNPTVMPCKTEYPSFLTFQAGVHEPDEVANDFACIATLGTDGCGFEQQLESTLKALWPSSDDSLSFLGDAQGLGKKGHGDMENAGFLRPSTGDDTSLLAVVLVTDENDCSSSDLSHLVPPHLLPPGDPLQNQGLNVRCHLNPQNLFPIDRYVDGLRALRPGNEKLVVFGAITGVPPALVDPEALAKTDFEDAASVTAFYDRILGSDEMVEVIDDATTPEPQDDRMKPSCMTTNGKAYPPTRIVEVAKEFGKNSIVQSICQDDFGPAVDAIVVAITRAQKSACIVQ